MPSALKQFKARAFARTKVKKAYDDLAEELAFLDEVLKARAESGPRRRKSPRASVQPSRRSRAWNPRRQSILHRSPRFDDMPRLSDTNSKSGS